MSSSMNLASAHGGEGDQLQVAWAAIRAGLRADVGTRTFDHWLKPVELVGYCDTDKAVRLSLPSDFMASWVSSHYTDRLTLAWRAMLPHVRAVRIERQGEVLRQVHDGVAHLHVDPRAAERGAQLRVPALAVVDASDAIAPVLHAEVGA